MSNTESPPEDESMSLPIGRLMLALGQYKLRIIMLEEEIVRLKGLTPMVQLPSEHFGFSIPTRKQEPK